MTNESFSLRSETERWRVKRGECLSVLASMDTASVDCVLCDPPYGTTQAKWDDAISFLALWPELERVARPNAFFLLFAADPFTPRLILSNLTAYQGRMVWVKPSVTGFLNAKRAPMRNHEDLVIFCRDPQRVKDRAGRPGFDAPLRYPVPSSKERHHPTQKPVAMLRELLERFTSPDEVVLDYTMGSGSTGVACVEAGRRFLGIERDPAYYKISVDRIRAAELDEGV